MGSIDVLILILTFLTFLTLGVPIAYSVGLSSLFTILVNIETIPAMTTIAQQMATGIDSFALLAIPFFILAGQIMNQGGIAERLIKFTKALVGALPGGLAHVNIIGAMLFGAISGSAIAAATAIGGAIGPQMEKQGFDKAYSAATNIASSTTGLIIPPSNVLIVYSLASGGASVGALFLAGYIPGILIGLSLMIIAYVYAIKKNYPRGERSKLKVIFRTFLDAIPSLFMLVLIIGGIVMGVFTATEASGVAVLYALVLAGLYRELTKEKLRQILRETVLTSAVVMLLIACSIAMSWVMAYAEIPQSVSAALLSISDNPVVILLMINLILLFVGVFMDITPAILIFTPIFLPVVIDAGMDPVHFGIVMVMNLCIGLCTPPVGSVLFVGISIAKVPLVKVLRPLLPMFIVMIIVLLMVTFIPSLSMFLPEVFS